MRNGVRQLGDLVAAHGLEVGVRHGLFGCQAFLYSRSQRMLHL